MAQDTTDRLVGTTIDGRYHVESRIARGGMAKVYLATDVRLERKVAVKVMHDHLVDDTEYAAKFIREARHTARLAHPNIVSVFDQGHEGDILFLVMEYLPGITLRELLNDYGVLTVEQALDITTAVLQALSVAHREGILHRDIKPENIILVNDGRIKVGDFGLARPVSTATETGKSLLGTVAYIAPELLTRGQADSRSDLYSVGIMLYEMLVGKQPFTGENPMQIALQHAKKPMPFASVDNESVGSHIDAVIQKATAKDPSVRPRDARSFLDALRAASTQRTVDAVTTGTATIADDDMTGATRVLDVVSAQIPDDATHAVNYLDSVNASHANNETIEIVGLANARSSSGNREDQSAPTPVRRPARSGRNRFARLALLVALLGVGATATWWFTGGPGSMATVVDVSGMSETEAVAALTNARFVVVDPAVERYDDNVPAGQVIGTDPAITEPADKGTEIHLVISLGPEPVSLPAFTDITTTSFASQLAGLKIAVTATDEQFNKDIESGFVISVIAEDGTQLTEGSVLHHGDSVTIASSLGAIPDVSGLSVAKATAKLEAVGLVVTVSDTREFSDDVPEGKVSSVSSSRGTVRPGDTVSVVLSKGPEMIAVPATLGLTIKDANDALIAAGFEVIIITDIPREFWDDSFAKAKNTSPAAGSEAPKGSTVTLYGIF